MQTKDEKLQILPSKRTNTRSILQRHNPKWAKIHTDIVGHALGGLVRKVATHHAKVEAIEQEQHAGRAERVAKQQRQTENVGHDHKVAADRGRKAHLVDDQEELVHLNAQTQASQICECKRARMFSQS